MFPTSSSWRPTFGTVRFVSRHSPDLAIDPVNRSDRELVAALAGQHADAALTVLIARHQPLVRATCARCLGRGQLWVDDACQAVFLVLARQASRIRDGQAL